MIVRLVCHDCQHINKDRLGMPGFELLEYEFDSFSDAYTHMVQHPNHHISISIIEESEN